MNNEHSDTQPCFTFDEVCTACGLDRDSVVTYISEGLVEVRGNSENGWQFSETHIVRIQKARRLEQDLRLNPAGSVLALELMAKIDELQTRLKRYEQSLIDNE